MPSKKMTNIIAVKLVPTVMSMKLAVSIKVVDVINLVIGH
jgi:hypothetical protein